MDAVAVMWEECIGRALDKDGRAKFLAYVPKVCLPSLQPEDDPVANIQTLEGPGPWDRTLLDVEMEDPAAPTSRDGHLVRKKVLLFSSNDYLNLSTHPAVREASVKVRSALSRTPSPTCASSSAPTETR